MFNAPVMTLDEFRRTAALDRAIALSNVLDARTAPQVIANAQAFEFYLMGGKTTDEQVAALKQVAEDMHDGDAYGGRFVDEGFDHDVSHKGGVDA